MALSIKPHVIGYCSSSFKCNLMSPNTESFNPQVTTSETDGSHVIIMFFTKESDSKSSLYCTHRNLDYMLSSADYDQEFPVPGTGLEKTRPFPAFQSDSFIKFKMKLNMFILS